MFYYERCFTLFYKKDRIVTKITYFRLCYSVTMHILRLCDVAPAVFGFSTDILEAMRGKQEEKKKRKCKCVKEAHLAS